MKAFDITYYMWNVFELTKANKLSNIFSGLDLFVKNLELGYERYPGSGIDNFDIVCKRWNKLGDAYKNREKLFFRNMINKGFGVLCDSWNAGDKKSFTQHAQELYTECYLQYKVVKK